MFLLPLVVYVLAQGPCGQAQQTRRAADSDVDTLPVPWSPGLLVWVRSLPWVALGALLVGQLIGFPLLVLLPLALYGALLAVERSDRPAAAFALWAFALVCLVCFGTEIVYIRDGFEGSSSRMNTIFKFYYQAWLIWATLAGYALWWLVRRRMTNDERRTTAGARALRWSLIGLLNGVFVLLLAGALLYPWLTAGKTFREAQRVGLVGQTPREGTPDGAAAIEWLRQNTAGNAVLLEAVGGSYSPEGFGGVSAATGLATIMGWPGHEDQWRGGDPAVRAQIGPRQEDVKTIYSTPSADEARALLKKYKVDYIYVGQLEQQNFPPEGLSKLAQLGEPVFQQGEVTIYRVAGS
jgi:YYY domain-containing protein